MEQADPMSYWHLSFFTTDLGGDPDLLTDALVIFGVVVICFHLQNVTGLNMSNAVCLCLRRTLLRRKFSLHAFGLANSVDVAFLPTLIASGLFEKTVRLRVLRETLRTRLPRTTMFSALVFSGRFGLICGGHFVHCMKTSVTLTFGKLISLKCLKRTFPLSLERHPNSHQDQLKIDDLHPHEVFL